MKIIITGGKSATALKLLKAFANSEVVLADYGEVPSFSSANYTFISLGQKNEDTLAHALLSQCLDNQVDAILPLHYFEIESLAKADILFNEFNVYVLVPNRNTYKAYLDQVLVSKENWVVYSAGEIVFSTQHVEKVIAYGKKENLSGAFYFEVIEEELKLSLITVKEL